MGIVVVFMSFFVSVILYCIIYEWIFFSMFQLQAQPSCFFCCTLKFPGIKKANTIDKRRNFLVICKILITVFAERLTNNFDGCKTLEHYFKTLWSQVRIPHSAQKNLDVIGLSCIGKSRDFTSCRFPLERVGGLAPSSSVKVSKQRWARLRLNCHRR